ncbi:MAG: hypothetical protein A2234_07785 [Elusimicrobia bacterium RIFOXYA2_FULL_58_8]|nr:MAG: hypothetical protein A2234_07785 [Elusimicrobia bacterium RIFOXYA2_FULL_58_8]OGS14165.1 MAG: hypothetical protein A2285_07855 [Elusimicrobia bacterium RIFOXYA12_FULL_57_11]
MLCRPASRFLLLSGACFFYTAAPVFSYPKNIIFMIGDGMGPEQIRAAGMYANGLPGTLGFELFPDSGTVTTYSANNAVTDSAAAATAMATGVKVNNYVVSMAPPGYVSELQTLLEYFQARGKRTGLVTTDVITAATPAAFGSHEDNRSNTNQIASDYLTQTRPNVLLGGGGNGMSAGAAQAADYLVVTDRAGMQGVDTLNTAYLSGQFGTSTLPYEYDGMGTMPHLTEMTQTALSLLENSPEGFFLLVEGAKIDHSAHSYDTTRNIFETIEFSSAAQAALAWAAGRTDTLIIVTADHETNGLVVTANNGINVLPSHIWTGGGNHTGVDVPLYAWGMNSALFAGPQDNTDFFAKVTTNPYSISGYITDSGAQPASDIQVSLSGQATASTNTAGSGFYTFENLAAGAYTVTPLKSSWTFEPASRNVAVLSDIQAAWDFSMSQFISVLPAQGGALTLPYPGGSAGVSFPANSFTGSVNITLQKPASFPAGQAGGTGTLATGIGVEIGKDTPAQPSQNVTLTLYYQDADMAGREEARMTIARYSDTAGLWVPLLSSIYPSENRITAQTDHLSLFQLMWTPSSTGLAGARVYPNPFYPSRGHTRVNFTSLPSEAAIHIYTIAGELVRKLKANTAGIAQWDGKNAAGHKAASGIYLGVIKSGGGKKTFKLAVVR